MKTNQTSFGTAIIKIVSVFCMVVAVAGVNAQANLGDRYTSDALIAAASVQNPQTKAENFKNAAARFWQLADEGKPGFKEARLKLALQYADSSKLYYMMEQNRLQVQLAKQKDSLSKATYTYLVNKNGSDTINVNQLISGIKQGLKKFAPASAQSTASKQGGPGATPEKKDSTVETEMTRLDLTLQPQKPVKVIMRGDEEKEEPGFTVATGAKQNSDPKANSQKKDSTTQPEPQRLEVIPRPEPMKVTWGGDEQKEKTDSLKTGDGKPIGFWYNGPNKTKDDLPEAKPYNFGREEKSNSKEMSKVIVTDVPLNPESKNIISWETGVDAGLTWSPMPGPSEPSFIHLTDPSFGTDSQVQEMWNEIFKGVTFPEDKDMKITNSPGWQLGFNVGCIINKRFEIKLAVAGGTSNAKAVIPVRVVKMVTPSSPSAPPTTQQSTETIEERALIGNFNSKLTGRVYFGKKARGYVEAGGVVGINHSGAIQISAADYSEKKGVKQTTVYGGGTIGAGVNIPLTDILNFETGISTDLVSVNKKFSAGLGLNAGIRILF